MGHPVKTEVLLGKDFVAIGRKYAEDVVSGVIPACKYVRQTCQRQLLDLVRTPFAWNFDLAKAERVCRFIELLPHIKGKWKTKLIVLEPWQIFILTTVFGWVDADGNRRFRTVYIEVPRKNSKSTITAGVALYCLCENEPGAEVYSAATKKDQAKIVWDVAKRMVQKTPGLRRRFGVDVSASSIFVESRAATFVPLSSDEDGLDGLNIHFADLDELHAHKTRAVWDVLDSATGSRTQPLIWAITTAGSNRNGVCYEQRQYVIDILSGAHEDDRYFGIIYSIDSEVHSAVLPFFVAVERVIEDCNCGLVTHTLINRSLLEECADVAMGIGGDSTSKRRAQTTAISQGRSRPTDCAQHATESGCLKTIQNYTQDTRINRDGGSQNTQDAQQRQSENGYRGIPNTAQSQTIGAEITELHRKSSSASGPSKKGNALFVEGLTGQHYAWITTTLLERLGGYSAGSAILASAYLETLRQIYFAHSATCKVRDLDFTNDGLIADLDPDDWKLEATWRKANPNYGVSVLPADVAALARKAIRSARSQNNFLTKRLDVWVNAENSYYNIEAWIRNRRPVTLADFERQPCWIGLDLSSKIDITAKARIFKRTERDTIKGKVPGTFIQIDQVHYYVFCEHYLPRDVLDSPENANEQHYSDWHQLGVLTLTPGSAIDYNTIEEGLREDRKRFRVLEVGYDRWNAAQLAERMEAEGLKMMDVPQQTKYLSDPMKTSDALILSGLLHHDGDPALQWQIGNVMSIPDQNGNEFPRNNPPSNKKDAAVAMITALARALSQMPKKKSVYSSRGIFTLS